MINTIEGHYQAIRNPSGSPSFIREYVTPAQYFDPRKEIWNREMADYKNRARHKRLVTTSGPRKSFVDLAVAQYSSNPGPNKYKTLSTGFFGEAPNMKDMKRARSASLFNKVNSKAKRGSYIDEI
jgi:hypothetical protein